MGDLSLNQVRVLVVDDDRTFLKIMESYLNGLGCRAVFCANGVEAVERVRAHAFDICFMDIMMPQMNGVEAACIIREQLTKVLPIIAITSSNMKATQDKCLEIGMNDFLVKPVNAPTIEELIKRYALRHP